MRQVYWTALFAVMLAIMASNRADAWCPFCNFTGSTLSQEAASAGLILYGTAKNARLDPKDFAQGTTDLDIEVVIKSHKILADRKTVTLPKYLPPPDPKQPMKLLVFCDVFKDQLDPYRGIPFKADSRIAEYLKGSIDRKEKSTGERLKFFFEYLHDADEEIARDALMEFGNAEYNEYRLVAEKFPPEKIVGWLKDPGIALSRLGLYASMLGHCGKPEHAQLLKDILDDPNRRFSGGIDGVLAGLVMLNHKDGWDYVSDIMNDPKKEFLIRYAALRAARFLWEFRPDVVDRKKIAADVSVMIEQPNIADLVIEDLRKWSYWTAAPKILDLTDKTSHDAVLIRKSILRYMLRCPATESPAAAAYVAKEREKNPSYVKDVESLLGQESGITPAANSKTSGGK